MTFNFLFAVVNVSGGNVSGSNTVTVRVGGKTPPPVPPPPKLIQSDAHSGAALPAIMSASGSQSNSGTTITHTSHTSATHSPIPSLPSINSDGQAASSHPSARARKSVGNGSAVVVLGGESPTDSSGNQNGRPNGAESIAPPVPGNVSPQANHQPNPPQVASNATNGKLPTNGTPQHSASSAAAPKPPGLAPRPANRHHRAHKNKRNSGQFLLKNFIY